MSFRSSKNGRIKPLSDAFPASRIVLNTLEDLGFELEGRQLSVREAHPRLKIDFVLRRGSKKYALDVKSSRNMHLAFMHLLPRAILRLQAVNRIGSLLPLVAIVSARLELRGIRRMAEYMNFYAPQMGWLLLDEQGRAVYRDQESDRFALLNERRIEWIDSVLSNDLKFFGDVQLSLSDRVAVSDIPSALASSSSSSSSLSSSRMQLSFSDVDQWLLKVFLLGPLDAASDYWGGPKGHAENAFQLSKLANVSSMPASLWVRAMEANGYLKRVGRRNMIVLRPDSILEEWVGRYRFSDNHVYPYRSLYPVSEYDALLEELLVEIRRYGNDLEPLAIAAHQACKLHAIKYSTARSIHIYCWHNVHDVAKILNLVPSEDEKKADVFLVEPKYPRSVFGGVLKKKEIPVCDILQCYLDLFYLPDRGREQASVIYESIISRTIRISHGDVLK